MLFGYIPRIASALIALTVLSCSMQANLEEFIEEGISIVKITSSSYSQGVSPNIVANRSVLSGSEVTVNLEFLNPEGLDLEYEIGYDTNYIDGGEIPTIDPTGPKQNSVSFTFTPLPAAENQTIVFTIAIRSPKFNKIVERGIVSIRCVSKSNTDLRLQAILDDQNVTYNFSSTGQTFAIMDLTTNDWLTIIPTAEVSGQKIKYDIEAGGFESLNLPLTSGIQTPQFLQHNYTSTLKIWVTSPDDSTTRSYLLIVPQGFTVISGRVCTVADFQAAIGSNNHIKLGGDIRLSDSTTAALITNTSGEFFFDGNGYTISGMSIQGIDDGGLGLVAVNNGIIKNLALENVNITCADSKIINAGGLAGYNYGTLYRCSVSGTITAASNFNVIGGLVGQMNGGSGYIAECYSTARITGYEVCGGLAGEFYNGTILNCYSRGTVSGEPTATDVGGLFGKIYSNAIVSNSYATDASTGELIGTSILGTVIDCSYGSPITDNWNITNTLNPAYVWGKRSDINDGYPYLQYFGTKTMLP